MIQSSNDMAEWTRDVLRVEYRDRVSQLGGHSIPRTLSALNASGNDIIDPMLDGLQNDKPNVTLLGSAKFRMFRMSRDGMAVDGVEVEREDASVKTSHCRCGVVLAAGGFSAEVPFRSIQNPSFGESVMTTNQPGATAEVI